MDVSNTECYTGSWKWLWKKDDARLLLSQNLRLRVATSLQQVLLHFKETQFRSKANIYNTLPSTELLFMVKKKTHCDQNEKLNCYVWSNIMSLQLMELSIVLLYQ